jgi:two-component system, NarL family, sensor histidine kinase DevS
MDAHPALQFPDAPKLELDALIDQLVDRARDVQHSQGRLRALLRAIEKMTEDPSLEGVLLNVVQAACTLADAHYGALGVIGPDDGLEQFIHVGMTEQEVSSIGRTPEGRGLLGALINDPRPIRLPHMFSDKRSTGFPTGHPPMDSFLGVPVRVHGEVFGNLYLTNSAAGQFSAEDEELVGALAIAAGTAISNARLLSESRLQQRWLTASVEISAQLLADVGEDPLQVICRRAIEIADADIVAVSVLTPGSSELMVEAAWGHGATDLLGRRFPVATSRVRPTLEQGTPLLLAQIDEAGPPSDDEMFLDSGPLMAFPLESAHGVRGVLVLGRARGRRSFGEIDLAMAATFAGHASIALELAAARSAAQRLVRSEDRERIARNLHDHVIQELFAIGLGLETAATFVEPEGEAARRITQRVRDIDRTIRQIRTSIFELRGPLDASAGGTRSGVLQIGADLADALGFAPQTVFAGLVDVRLAPDLAEDVLACVREVLTNVAKHARATRADVDLSVTPADITVVVTDDGIGYTPNGRLSGLANLRARAERRGGSFTVSAADGGGTTTTWKAPL